MQLNDLKLNIINNTLSDEFKIFIYEDSTYLVNQYIDRICSEKRLNKVEIEALSAIDKSWDLLFQEQTNLFVLNTETFSERYDDYSNFCNVIVVCKKIDKLLLDVTADYSTLFPKLQSWQMVDYVKTLCKGLDGSDCAYLVAACNNDMYKLANECNKISLFATADQRTVLNELKNDKNSELVSFPVYKLTEAIVSKNKLQVGQLLYYRNVCDFEPTGVVTLLLREFKKLLFCKFNNKLTPAQIGIEERVYYAIKRNNIRITENELLQKIKFLTAIDQKIKLGELDIGKDAQLDYIISNML